MHCYYDDLYQWEVIHKVKRITAEGQLKVECVEIIITRHWLGRAETEIRRHRLVFSIKKKTCFQSANYHLSYTNYWINKPECIFTYFFVFPIQVTIIMLGLVGMWETYQWYSCWYGTTQLWGLAEAIILLLHLFREQVKGPQSVE